MNLINLNGDDEMRKISQIIECNGTIVALCLDGTLWQLPQRGKEWLLLEGIPARPTNINDLEMALPKKAVANLQKAGIRSIEALTGLTKEEASGIPGLGAKTVFDIESELKSLGLHFRKNQPG